MRIPSRVRIAGTAAEATSGHDIMKFPTSAIKTRLHSVRRWSFSMKATNREYFQWMREEVLFRMEMEDAP